MSDKLHDPTKTVIEPHVKLRDATEEDIEFIFSSWLKSYRGSLLYSKVQSSIYYPEMHKLVEKLLINFPVVIACDVNEPSTIYGWICAGEVQGVFCLHYIYVKHLYRRFGIGSMLFNHFKHDETAAGIYTHTTKVADEIAKRYGMIHHPFILLNDYVPAMQSKPEVVSSEDYEG